MAEAHAQPTTVTEAQLTAAFTEWDRRYREEPERFQSEAVRFLRDTPQTYGEKAAPYLLAILAEQVPDLVGEHGPETVSFARGGIIHPGRHPE